MACANHLTHHGRCAACRYTGITSHLAGMERRQDAQLRATAATNTLLGDVDRRLAETNHLLGHQIQLQHELLRQQGCDGDRFGPPREISLPVLGLAPHREMERPLVVQLLALPATVNAMWQRAWISEVTNRVGPAANAPVKPGPAQFAYRIRAKQAKSLPVTIWGAGLAAAGLLFGGTTVRVISGLIVIALLAVFLIPMWTRSKHSRRSTARSGPFGFDPVDESALPAWSDTSDPRTYVRHLTDFIVDGGQSYPSKDSLPRLGLPRIKREPWPTEPARTLNEIGPHLERGFVRFATPGVVDQ